MSNFKKLLDEKQSGFTISFFRLVKLFDYESKKKILTLAFLSTLTSMAEVLMIYTFTDFVLYLQKQDDFDFSELFISNLFIVKSINQIIYILITITIFTTVLRLLISWLGFKYQAVLISQISKKILEKINSLGYENRFALSDSEKISMLSIKASSLGNSITAFIAIVNGSLLGIGIFLGIFLRNGQIITIFVLSILTIYLILAKNTRNTLTNNSKIIAAGQTKQMDIIKRFTKGLRETILESLQGKYIQSYYKNEKLLRSKLATNAFINAFPKFIIEAILIIAITIIALFSLSENDSYLIAELGGISLGTLRFMPCFQSVYSSVSSIRGVSKTIFIIFEVLFNPRKKIKPNYGEIDNVLSYKNKPVEIIEANNISYSYPRSNYLVLDKCSIIIKKSQKICILGESGVGKSTLMDILIGLISTKKGTVLINKKNIWNARNRDYADEIRKQFSCISLENHIPNQNIFEYITDKKIENAKSKDFIDSKNALLESEFYKKAVLKKDDLKILTGEDCENLSSGQKQRLLLARAIYKKNNWLFLDEPTSSIDKETSKKIIKMLLDKSKLTLFLITHDLEIAKMFNIRYLLKNKKLERLQ